MTVKQAAQQIRASDGYIYRLIRAGRLKVHQNRPVNDPLDILESSINQFIKTRKPRGRPRK